jgi:long-chain acyl-CoA synthetase
MDDRPGLLLTGATGFVGGEVLARLLERGDRPVYALVRGADEGEAHTRLRRTVESLMGSAEPWASGVTAVAADLSRPDLGMHPRRRQWLAARVERIVHCAASVSFTLDLDESRAINVEGTRRMLDFAELAAHRGGLGCFTHVSTAYVAGTHRGRFSEWDLDVRQGFRNGYERSKFESEMLVRERGTQLPVQVLRPSIVVGDSRSGWTPAFNVLYWPLRAFTKGVYPAIPARRSSPVDVVPVDYVADAILALAGRPGTSYHLTAGENTSTIGELIELATAFLERLPPRVLPPAVYRRAIHPLLVRSGSESRRRALRPRGIEPPPLGAYFERLMAFALEADWGRRQVARPGHSSPSSSESSWAPLSGAPQRGQRSSSGSRAALYRRKPHAVQIHR